MRKNKKYYIRKIHRVLGVSIGIQFLFWTVSGLYFSWTDIDEIHGDHFMKSHMMHHEVTGLKPIGEILGERMIHSLQLRHILRQPYYLVDDKELYHAVSGEQKTEITKEDAIGIAELHIQDEYKVQSAELLSEVGKHHEIRGRDFPIWAVSFDSPESLTAYISAQDGSFQRVRHRDWRWFDFLWMFHTMDYEGRDDFNNFLLRVFSLFGLFTVLSGFLLYFSTSKSFKKRF